MRHYTCDLCGKSLTPADEPRFLVRIEGFAVTNTEPLGDDSEADSVDAMEELLTEQVAFEAMSELQDELSVGAKSAKREYDLCQTCYAKMLSDPLRLGARRAPRFSTN